MVFQNGNIDEDITAKDQFMDFDIFQFLAVFHLHQLVIGFRVTRNDLTAAILHCLFDATVFITFRPVITSIVEHVHRFRSCCEATLDDVPDQIGIGTTGSFRGHIPADIRFDHHRLPSFHEGSDATQGFYSLIKHDCGTVSFYRYQVVQRRW